MTGTVIKLTRALKRAAEADYREAQQWFFKEKVHLYGVRVGMVRKIAQQFWRDLASHDKAAVFKLCAELVQIDRQETRIVAFAWAERLRPDFSPGDFRRFERWLKHEVSNWASCDALCSGPLGRLLEDYPALVTKTVPWRRSRSRWVRRAAAVCLIRRLQGGKSLPDVFAAARALLHDEDDLVQKGYGWMLKEASNRHPRPVFDFVMRHKNQMPRTALRYAIEKMPAAWKRRAMARG